MDVPSIFRALRCTISGRRLMARVNAIWFAVYYLGLWYAAHQQKWLNRLRALRGSTRRRLLLLAPRAHGKTETIVSFVSQEVAENRAVRILLISKTAEGAKKRLRRIKANLEGNARLIHDFGRFRPAKLPAHLAGITDIDENGGRGKRQIGYWTERYIYVERNSDKTDPTIEAVGWQGAILGGRFDLIICDDPIDSKLAQSETERAKAREWFYDTVLELLEPDGRIVVIGTRKHGDDLYQTLIDDPTFDLLHEKGIVKWPEHFEAVTTRDEYGREILVDIDIKGEAEVLWPERWPVKSLLGKLLAVRATVGSTIFLREIQNEVHDDGASQFPLKFFDGGEHSASPSMPARMLPGCYDRHRSYMHDPFIAQPDGDWISPYPTGVTARDLGLDRADLVTFQMWDLSLVTDKQRAEKNDTDYTVGLTLAIDKLTWRRYLVSIWRERGLKPNAIFDAIVSEYWRFGGPAGVYKVVIESVLFQEVYKLMIAEETSVPVIGHSTGAEKADPYKGIPYLSALCENGKLRLPYRTAADREVTSVMVKELNQWPNAKHDDTLLSWFVGEQKIGEYERKLSLRGRGARVTVERRETQRI